MTLCLRTEEGKYKKADTQQENYKELHLDKIKRPIFRMAVLWLIQSTIATLNIILGILFVLANKDFCGSIVETRVGE